jgi:hypothetical protein
MIYLARAFLPFWCVVAGASYGAMHWISTQHPSADTEIRAAYQELESWEVEKARLEADALAHKEFDKWFNDRLEKITQEVTIFEANEISSLKIAKRNKAVAIEVAPEAVPYAFGQPDPVVQEFRRRVPSAYDDRREVPQPPKPSSRPASLPVDSLNGQELAMIEVKTAALNKKLMEDLTGEAAKKNASLPSDPGARLAKNRTRTTELENLIEVKWKLQSYHAALWKAAFGLFFAAFIGVCASDLALAFGGGFHRILIRQAGWIITAFLCLSLAIAFWFLYRNGPFVELATIGKWSLGYLGGFVILIVVSETSNANLRYEAAKRKRENAELLAREQDEARRKQQEQERRRAEDERKATQAANELIAKAKEIGRVIKADPHRYVTYRNELVAFRLLNADYLEATEFPVDDIIETVRDWQSQMEQSSDRDAMGLEAKEKKWVQWIHWQIQLAAAKGRLLQMYDQVGDIVSTQLPRETFRSLLMDIGAKNCDPAREKIEFQNLEQLLAKLSENHRERWQTATEQNAANKYFELFEASSSNEKKSDDIAAAGGETRKGIGGHLGRTVDA